MWLVEGRGSWVKGSTVGSQIQSRRQPPTIDQGPTTLQEAVSNGVCGRLGAGGDVQLAKDAGDVVLDRARADVERIGDLGVRAALDDEGQHLRLPRGQGVLRWHVIG